MTALSDEDEARQRAEREAAQHYFGIENGLLSMIADKDSYLGSVRDLVTAPDSTARRIAAELFPAVPYHVTYKCNGCLYNEYCMKRSAETDDLSLLPHLTATEKGALQRNGIQTTHDPATLKEFRTPGWIELLPMPGIEGICRKLAST